MEGNFLGPLFIKAPDPYMYTDKYQKRYWKTTVKAQMEDHYAAPN